MLITLHPIALAEFKAKVWFSWILKALSPFLLMTLSSIVSGTASLINLLNQTVSLALKSLHLANIPHDKSIMYTLEQLVSLWIDWQEMLYIKRLQKVKRAKRFLHTQIRIASQAIIDPVTKSKLFFVSEGVDSRCSRNSVSVLG